MSVRPRLVRLVAVWAVVAMTGCIFGGNGGSDNSTNNSQMSPDMEDDRPDLEAADVGDTPTRDGGTQPHDMREPDVEPPPDMAEGTDAMPVPDVAPPVDMGVERPFRVERDFMLQLGSAQPAANSPGRVAALSDGFLAGYVDTSVTPHNVQIGHYTEDSAQVVQSHGAEAGSPSFDLAGEGNIAYATMSGPEELSVIQFEADPQAPSLVVTEYSEMRPSDSVVYQEMGIGIADGIGLAGVKSIDQNMTEEVLLGIADEQDLGLTRTFTAVTRALVALEVAAYSEAGDDRSVIVAGVEGSRYGMIDYYFDSDVVASDPWDETGYRCGSTPVLGRKRIVPVRGPWALTLSPADSWDVTRCQTSSAPGREEIVRPNMSADVQDFDVAEETNLGNEIAVAWIQAGNAWMGVIELDEGTGMATMQTAQPVYVGQAVHVRTAVNPNRGTHAVLVQTVNEARLILLKPN